MPKFFTSKGFLTKYAMACGYIHEQFRDDKRITMELVNAELNLFEVKSFDTKTWSKEYKTFISITQARKAFKTMCDNRLDMRFESNPSVNRLVVK